MWGDSYPQRACASPGDYRPTDDVNNARRAARRRAESNLRARSERARERQLNAARLVSVQAVGWESDRGGNIVFKLVVTTTLVVQQSTGTSGAGVISVYRRWSELEALRSRLRHNFRTGGQRLRYSVLDATGLQEAIRALPVKYKSVTLGNTTRLQKRSCQINGDAPWQLHARTTVHHPLFRAYI